MTSTTRPTNTAPSEHLPAPLEAPLGVEPASRRSPVRRGTRALRALASDVGQGTVEYVGLLLLMATVLAAVVGAASQLGGRDEIGKKVVQQVGKSIDKAGSGSGDR